MPEEIGKIKPIKESKWFKKIPKEFLFSPGGIVLIFVALLFEISDFLFPDYILPGAFSLAVEIVPDLIFALLLKVIANISFKSSVIPFLIERIPVVSDILPTWLIRLFI